MNWIETVKEDFLSDTGRGFRNDTDKGLQVPAIESDSGMLLTRLGRVHRSIQLFRYRDGCIDVVLRGQLELSNDSGYVYHIFLSLALRWSAKEGTQTDADWIEVKKNISEAFSLWSGFARVGDLPIISVQFT